MARVLLLFSLLLLSACQERELITVYVGKTAARVELAATADQRREGLMYRQSLGSNQGLLLVFARPKEQKMWMLNTRIPLDVGFFDAAGVLLNVATMEPDGGKTIHRSVAPALYALEMNRGWFSDNGLVPGERLTLPATIRGR